MDTSKRVVIYARVSTKEQTVENQLRDLRGFCSHRGWTILAEHMDEGISGATEKRAGLTSAMELCRKGKCDILLVWRFDRFARSVSHLVRSLEELRRLNVDFVSYNENVDTSTAQGRMFFSIVAAIAEFERELIRERIFSGLRRAQADGVRLGRPDLPAEKVKAILALAGQRSQRDIAAMTGVGKGTVYRVLRSAPRNPVEKVAFLTDDAAVGF